MASRPTTAPIRPLVLSDASPIIALSLIDRLDLLAGLFGAITITETVRAEVLPPGSKPGVSGIAAAIEAERIRVVADPLPDPPWPFLDEGEATTLRAALNAASKSRALVLIDERAGRALAHELGLAHTGTVGVIVQAKRRGMIASSRAFFEALLAHEFRVSAAMIRAALEQTGEV